MAYELEDAHLYLDEHATENLVEKHADEVAGLMVSFAEYAQEIHMVTCKRCDKQFRSVDSVEYCSKGCELGYRPGEWWC